MSILCHIAQQLHMQHGDYFLKPVCDLINPCRKLIGKRHGFIIKSIATDRTKTKTSRHSSRRVGACAACLQLIKQKSSLELELEQARLDLTQKDEEYEHWHKRYFQRHEEARREKENQPIRPSVVEASRWHRSTIGVVLYARCPGCTRPNVLTATKTHPTQLL